MVRLGGIERALEISLNDFLVNLQKNLTKEYQDILKQEEDLWVMKSSVNWVIENERLVDAVKGVLEEFTWESRQKVSLAKSRILLSKNTGYTQ
ncbi:hypothetical protein PVK06_012049 [Gossypium arboreum]|uniref:Uncharacterized protein n=1 Tax=Gossypium arboreum TaxID=29729 RepID=A0ABR0QAB5_GOSAR|nr:hypothetical protein PVK06_012049 [Gossypium arboreum]